MKFFKHEQRGPVTVYPLVCWHLGAQQSDERFIKEHVDRIADDPTARWIYLGDGGECVTKQSKGDIYAQKYGTQQQLDAFADYTAKIRDKGLFGITGNHDRRIYKETGIDFADALCTKAGIPYLGASAFLHLRLAGTKTQQVSYSVFCHHGVDSGANIGTKANAARRLEQLVIADCILSAHSHIALELPPTYMAYVHQGREVVYHPQHSIICGCAYDSRTGYAEDKGYSPLLPAHVGVTFAAPTTGRKGKNITTQIWRAEV